LFNNRGAQESEKIFERLDKNLILMSSYIYENSNSKSFFNMAWISFVLSMIAMVIALGYLELDFSSIAFIGVCYVFSISSCFTLAKVVRDRHEAEKFLTKVEKSKTEKYLSEQPI